MLRSAHDILKEPVKARVACCKAGLLQMVITRDASLTGWG